MTLEGIDVSNYQGSVDLTQVAAAGRQFVMIKASEGITYADRFFPGNWNTAKAANLARGAYHFAHPELNNPVDEANYFLSVLAAVGGVQEGDLVALDMELGSGDLHVWVDAFVLRIEAVLGFTPVLYSSPSFIADHGLNTPTIARCGLWIANYGVATPAVPSAWPVWAFHQYSDAGRVPGVSGAVDLDKFNGTMEQLLQYGKPHVDKPVPTNDDLVYFMKFITAEPPNLSGLATAIATFV